MSTLLYLMGCALWSIVDPNARSARIDALQPLCDLPAVHTPATLVVADTPPERPTGLAVLHVLPRGVWLDDGAPLDRTPRRGVLPPLRDALGLAPGRVGLAVDRDAPGADVGHVLNTLVAAERHDVFVVTALADAPELPPPADPGAVEALRAALDGLAGADRERALQTALGDALGACPPAGALLDALATVGPAGRCDLYVSGTAMTIPKCPWVDETAIAATLYAGLAPTRATSGWTLDLDRYGEVVAVDANLTWSDIEPALRAATGPVRPHLIGLGR